MFATGALLIPEHGAFVAGSDFLMDCGITAAWWCGNLAPKLCRMFAFDAVDGSS
jgi:hypothetical protein